MIGVTAVINKYPPIPVFEGEKYHSLYYKQHLLERDYTVLIMNKPVCVVEYMNDGSSKNMFYQYVRNPKGFCNERRYVMKYAPSFKLKIEACIHYVAESLLAKDYYFIGHSTNRLFTLISVVPGVLLYFIIKGNKEMKIAIIIAYFGKLPEYIQLFLDSCKLNYGFEWLIFSDDDTTYNYPSNVHLIKMNFGECKKLIQSKFDFEITLSKPQKLCDYKCAYGVIFEDYIQDYDWWGHCDLDQIFGNLNMFVTEDMLRKYDKLFSLGHLSLYKNSYKNNRIFMGKIEGKIRYKEVFVTERGCGFDEWLPGNVNDIYMQTNSPIMLENIGADINPYKTSFETVSFDINERCYKSNLIRNSIFEVAKGHLFQIYSVNGELHTREFPYVHLQKRKMRDLRKNKNSDNYYLIPNCFIDKDINPSVLLRVCTIWRVFNYQFFRVKINSLKYRFKNSDWKFTNVFK